MYVGPTICNQIPEGIGVYPCNANNELGIYAFVALIGDNLEVTVGFIGGKNILNIEGKPYTNIIYNQGDFINVDDIGVKIEPDKLFSQPHKYQAIEG